MHTYLIRDAAGHEMRVPADDRDGAQERFIDACEAAGIPHDTIVRLAQVD